MKFREQIEEIQLSNPQANLTVHDAFQIVDEIKMAACDHSDRKVIHIYDRPFFECNKCGGLRSIE